MISLAPLPNYWGVPILAFLAAVWLLARLGAVLVVQQFAVVAMLPAVVFTVLGWPVTRAVLFPLAFLMFAVPFGEELVQPLQHYTAIFTVRALQLCGVPVFRDGWLIVIPSGSWQVAEACAGVRYVIPSVILGCLFSYCVYTSRGRRLAFIFLCFVSAILANGIRAYGIVMLAHLSNNRLAIGVDHLIAGWIFFSVVVCLLFYVGLRWREPAENNAPGDDAVKEGKATPVAASPKALVLAAVGTVIVLGSALCIAHILSRPIYGHGKIAIPDPAVTAPWQPVQRTDESWKPNFAGASAQFSKRYAAGGKIVHLYIAFYRNNQMQGAELITAENALFDETQWLLINAGATRAAAGHASVSVEQLIIKSVDSSRVVWRWYRVAGVSTSSRYVAKVLEIKSRVFGKRKGSALVALSVDMENGDAQDAAETLRSFLRHVTLDEVLDEIAS